MEIRKIRRNNMEMPWDKESPASRLYNLQSKSDFIDGRAEGRVHKLKPEEIQYDWQEELHWNLPDDKVEEWDKLKEKEKDSFEVIEDKKASLLTSGVVAIGLGLGAGFAAETLGIPNNLAGAISTTGGITAIYLGKKKLDEMNEELDNLEGIVKERDYLYHRLDPDYPSPRNSR